MTKRSRKVTICHHVLPDGRVCGSPALKQQVFCYYHQRDRQRAANLLAYAAKRAKKKQAAKDADVAILAALNLPTPDDPVATQVCIAAILQAMMTGALSGALGGRLLYGLHLAKCNYRDLARYHARYTEPEIPLASVPVAATDPEPIPPVDKSADTYSDDYVERYAEHLEVDERAIPTLADEMMKVECATDDEFELVVKELGLSDNVKAGYLDQLTSVYRGNREQARRDLFQLIRQHLSDARKPKEQSRHAQIAVSSSSDSGSS